MLALIMLTTAVHPPIARAEPVDLLLVLAADVSHSVDEAKFHLQREGDGRPFRLPLSAPDVDKEAMLSLLTGDACNSLTRNRG